ncbi:MAG: hypothetical protein JKY45_00815 [Emcibacter sp.]|nr:hypothetical protein [Emcibacter sp.]
MIDGRTVMEVNPTGKSAAEIEDLWEYINDRLEKNFRRTIFQHQAVQGKATQQRGSFGRRQVQG